MANRQIVVVAASAGGIEALRQVLGGLPADFGAAVLVVLHMPAEGGKALPRILDRAGPLPASAAVDGEAMRPGHVYVCVADHHLLAGDGHLHVRRGPRENGHRPAADPLFRSAARYYGTRAIGVILSGTLDDGASGLQSIRRQGGIAVVQDPDDALYDGMPANALEQAGADHVAAALEIGPLLARLVKEEIVADGPDVPDALRQEVAVAEAGDRVLDDAHPGVPSQWPCPDCSGVLWAVDDGPIVRFRCRVGHAWSADSLLQAQGIEVEEALWMALRALEDRASLSRSLVERAESAGRPMSARRFRTDLDDMARSIEVLRGLLTVDAAGQDGAQGG